MLSAHCRYYLRNKTPSLVRQRTELCRFLCVQSCPDILSGLLCSLLWTMKHGLSLDFSIFFLQDIFSIATLSNSVNYYFMNNLNHTIWAMLWRLKLTLMLNPQNSAFCLSTTKMTHEFLVIYCFAVSAQLRKYVSLCWLKSPLQFHRSWS